MLTCPNCNYENELGRIFCHQCGTKLDLDQIKPPSRGGKSLAKKSGSATRVLGWVVRLVILAAVVLGVYLIAQVAPVEVVTTTAEDLDSFYRKRHALEKASYGSEVAEVKFTEAELNAYLDHTPFEKPRGQGLEVIPTNLQVNLQDDTAMVTLQGKIQIGARWSKEVSLSYTGSPVVLDDGFAFEPVAARIGKLPLPQWLLGKIGLMQRYFAEIFRNMKAEELLLDRLSSITVEPGQVILHYEPDRTDAPQ